MASQLKPVYEGAEAYLYLVEILGRKFIVKHRVSKPYRHRLFDKLFRQNRTRIEGKILIELYLSGVKVPAPLLIDLNSYIIVMEYIEGRKLLEIAPLLDNEKISRYAYIIGKYVGKMHSLNIFHGDLTLGNILVTSNDELYIIDFGLAGYSMDVEEYAIDIHLLRRSINAIIPDKLKVFMESFWKGYREIIGEEFYRKVLDRVREVALRGRYVSERLRRKYMREKYIE